MRDLFSNEIYLRKFQTFLQRMKGPLIKKNNIALNNFPYHINKNSN